MRRPDVFTLDYSHPLAQGLQLSYMGNGGNVVADSSLRRHPASVVGSTLGVAPSDVLGRNVLRCSGGFGTDRVKIANDPAFLNSGLHNFSMSFWAQGTHSLFVPAHPIGLRTMGLWAELSASNDRGFRLYVLHNPNSSTVQLWPNGIPGFAPFVWYNISFVFNTTSMSAYLNGRLTHTLTTGGPMPADAGDSNFLFSRNATDGKRPLDIADAVFYNRALSPAEIALLADRTDPMLGGLIVEERPVLYFDMGGSTTDELTASDLVTGSPVLGTPALGQAHALTATGITTSAPVFGAPALGQIHSLTASALVAGSPALGTPSLTENAQDVDALTAVDLVVGSPVLGTPSLGQIHVLGSDGLVTGAPVIGSPSITQIHTLDVLGLTVGVPVLGTPAITSGAVAPITAAEVARTVAATSRMKTVTAAARVKQVRYEVARA